MGWIRFSVVRKVVFGLLFIVSVAVLALTSYQASLFLENRFDRPWIIFGIVVSSISILGAGFLAYQYSFKTHIGLIAFLAILWLALASYTTDRIGYVQCESLDGTRRPTSHDDTYDNVSWCRQMKAIMGLAWFSFGISIIAIVSWIRLQEYEEKRGFGSDDESSIERMEFRREQAEARHGYPVQYQNGAVTGIPAGMTGYTTTTAPQQYATNPATGGQVIYQQPGHNIVVQNGQIRQVPVGQPFTV
ncbi:hypothetical protein FRB99_000226 [Tulasnella sp. 403]|nr:hypothetical protein FRB99_000226 [Tulasnella sp. 403]